jgi:cation:H+ antiporter
MAAATFLLAIAIYTGQRRRRAEGGYSYLGRAVGLLLTCFYALYYYALSLSL